MRRMFMVLTVGTLFLALAAGVALAATYYGNPYAETITGTSGNDDVRGAGGGDLLSGGSGSDRVLGGPGNDYVSDTNSGATMLRSTTAPASTPSSRTGAPPRTATRTAKRSGSPRVRGDPK
jgi:Ca2+-binding RTX toxin-like protein